MRIIFLCNITICFSDIKDFTSSLDWIRSLQYFIIKLMKKTDEGDSGIKQIKYFHINYSSLADTKFSKS